MSMQENNTTDTYNTYNTYNTSDMNNLPLDDLGCPFDPNDPSVIDLSKPPKNVIVAIGEHPEGYWQPPSPPPKPIEETDPELGRLFQWLMELNAKQKTASITGQKGRVEIATHGSVLKSEKVGRNDPCPCGSLKKFKKCCGKE